MIPASIKKQLTAVIDEGFVLRRSVFQKCLELYPMREWQALMGKMNTLNRFNKKHADFIRRFTAGAKLLDIDASGRLLIPKDLVLFSGISKHVVVASAINIVEIWDKTLYEKVVEDTMSDFADLAEEVMGQNETSNGVS